MICYLKKSIKWVPIIIHPLAETQPGIAHGQVHTAHINTARLQIGMHLYKFNQKDYPHSCGNKSYHP